MDRLKGFGRWCRRYVRVGTLMGLAFVVFMLFFNDHSMARGMELNATIDSLQREIESMRDTAAYYQDLNQKLTTDPETMERVVRENYNMKRPGEDVFVFK